MANTGKALPGCASSIGFLISGGRSSHQAEWSQVGANTHVPWASHRGVVSEIRQLAKTFVQDPLFVDWQKPKAALEIMKQGQDPYPPPFDTTISEEFTVPPYF